MRVLFFLFVLVILLALAGFAVRPSNRAVSNGLYAASAVLLTLLVLGFLRVV